MNAKPTRIRRLMACLGDRSRFRLVRTLTAGPRYVLQLAGVIGLSQSCTTRHLQTLVREGIVERRRQGKRVMFRLRLEEPLVSGLVHWAITQGESRGSRQPSSAGRIMRGLEPSDRFPGQAISRKPEADKESGAQGSVSGRDSGPSGVEADEDPENRMKPPSASRPYEELEDFLL